MSRSFPLPMRSDARKMGRWNLRPGPRTRSMQPSVDPEAVDMAALHALVAAVPPSLLPTHGSTPPSMEDATEPSISPLLRMAVAQNVLAPATTRSSAKRKSAMMDDSARKGKRLARTESDPSLLETQETKLASSVAKHQETLEQWSMDLADPRSAHRATKKIRHMLYIMHKSSKLVIARLPVEQLLDLMILLDVQVTEARQIDLFVQERLADEGRLLEDVNTALDAATSMLLVMTSPDVDRRLLSEEHIEHCVLLVKHVLQRLIYPALDAATYSVVVSEKERKNEKDKAHAALKKKMEKAGLVDIVYSFLDSLQELMGCLKLQDSWILQLSNVLMAVFAMDNQQTSISTVQLGALRMLRAIFVHYPAHRTLLLEDVFYVLVKLSTSKRNLRTYKVDDDYVQVIVVLLATLVQSCIVLSMDQVHETARSVVQLLLLKCMKKDDEVNARLHFEHFVEDVLVLLSSPDWPVAEVLVEALVAGLTGLLMSNKPETQVAVLALHLLGKIAASLKTITCRTQASEKRLLHNMEESNVTSASELLLVYVQQKSAHISEDAQAFHLSRVDEGFAATSSCNLSRDEARSVVDYFLAGRELCGHFETIFLHILGFLSRGQSTLRTRVLRSIVGIIDADPTLMTSEALQKAITSCLMDESNAVRQASVELVGKYVEDQPSLFPRYAEMLHDRVRDKGISVRKSVLKIYRHYIVNEFDVANAIVSTCLRTLIERLADPTEDETIKDFIVSTLQEVWFDESLPALQKRDADGAVIPVSLLKLKSKKTTDYGTYRVLSIMEVVQRVTKADWFVELIQRLRKIAGDDIDDYCESIVAGLLDLLLQLEEGTVLPHLTCREPDKQFVATLKTLHVFCSAIPELLEPYKDTLVVYLKPDSRFNRDVQAQVFALTISMISLVFSAMEKSNETWIRALEADLQALVLQAPPGVVKPSVECLARLVLDAPTKRQPTVLSHLLEKFYTFLVKMEPILKSNSPSLAAGQQYQLQRALFVTGLICGSLDWDAYENLNIRIETGKILERVYSVYYRFTLLPQSHPSFTVAFQVKNVQGFGFLFHRHPRLFLKAYEDGVITKMLAHECANVQLQMVVSLTELLEAEEARLEKAQAAKKQHKQQVQGDQQGDTSLIGSIMQAQLGNILTLAMHEQTMIRRQAVACIGLLVTQGVINPLECFATLVALEADGVAVVRDAAYRNLEEALIKCKASVVAPAVRGIYQSFMFQLKMTRSWTVQDATKNCLFGRMYQLCMQPDRARRHSFFNGLLVHFREKGQIFQSMADGSLSRESGLSYLAYITSILA
ncbi:hypothetical protein SPRG_10759 [Saprolegnia parasitica CBS 223.65]|uniref:Sister chromatid cohesion protein n=1 Tax=Saprolegnia parasitica (strain CBS 223.65) TaxID=695850 RepID=A0A067BYG0_SAPPC|nr:hypothetical protein SPRG_10759 [Saprolegnia parasitica CBS 223.65]KDO23564.1 hypothetical protein SPRG_10759 [Saprolegnia parasitica CBS 223.65]|eukprot:XP_012205714.1 hypothetical protein SPRG_10759 [Saprolegnia parasitica CBS 223.65]